MQKNKLTPLGLRIRKKTGILLFLTLVLHGTHFSLVELCSAAASGKPLFLVNTEAFQVIDDADTVGNPTLKFGEGLDRTITYNRNSERFEFNAGIQTSGNISGSGTFIVKKRAGTGTGNIFTVDTQGLVYDGTNKRVGIGTAAPSYPLHVNGSIYTSNTVFGTILSGISSVNGNVFKPYASNSNLRLRLQDDNYHFAFENVASSELVTILSSGAVGIGATIPETKLEVVGTMSGMALTVSNLLNCNTIDTDAAGNLSCGTDEGGGTGISQEDGDARYVNQSGDTMTGALVIDVEGGDAYTFGLRIMNTLSGAILHAEQSLTSSGTFVVQDRATFRGVAVFNEEGTATGNVRMESDTEANLFFFHAGLGRVGIGGTDTPETTLEVLGTISGALLTQNGAGSNYFKGSLGIGTTGPRTQLQIASPNASDTFTLGQPSGGFTLSNLNDAYGLGGGVLNTGDAWLQAGRFDGTATAYNMLLQQGGGNVGIGVVGTPETTLEVTGTMSGSALLARNLNNSLSATSGSILISRTAGAPEWKNPTGSMVWYLDGDAVTGARQGATITMPFGMTATSVNLRATAAPTGAALIVDINEAGTTLFSTRPEIAASATTGGGGAAFSDTAIAAGAELSIDIDQVGSSFAGSGITIQLNGIRKY